MSLRTVQRQAAQRYAELGSDLSSSLRKSRTKHHTSEINSSARLLRNSRLFALPPPLPQSTSRQDVSLKPASESDTATTTFPTRAAIVTPRSSLANGDWGLKRSLPDKAFKTTTPVIRLKANDTMDHITEFESASDHVFTLQKLQEMAIPTTVARSSYMGVGSMTRQQHPDGPLSTFEDSQDPKQIPDRFKDDHSHERGWGVEKGEVTKNPASRRWKYDSPWIAGMPTGEFEDYIRTAVKKRRVEFRTWLRQRLSEKREVDTTKPSQPALQLDQGISEDGADAESMDAAVDKIIDQAVGEEIELPSVVESTPSTEDTVASDILRLRAQREELFEYIWEFLDLPGRYPTTKNNLYSFNEALRDISQGPPRTHPSAGLSYLRPGPWFHNHASFGPLQAQPPVQARVLQRSDNGQKSHLVGVAGVAVDGSDLQKGNPALFRTQAMDASGGPKLWVLPNEVQVDTHGRLRLDLYTAHQDQVNAWREHSESDGADGEDVEGASIDLLAAARSGVGLDKKVNLRERYRKPTPAPGSARPLQAPDLSKFTGGGYKKRPEIKPFDGGQ